MKSAVKDETKIVLRLSSSMIDNSDDDTNFPYKLLLINWQVTKNCKAFANNLSANIKPSKIHLFKIVQSGIRRFS